MLIGISTVIVVAVVMAMIGAWYCNWWRGK